MHISFYLLIAINTFIVAYSMYLLSVFEEKAA